MSGKDRVRVCRGPGGTGLWEDASLDVSLHWEPCSAAPAAMASADQAPPGFVYSRSWRPPADTRRQCEE